MSLEETRLRYRPARIRLLLLGESPPRAGGFFYNCDSLLFREAKPVFVKECGLPSRCTDLLEQLRDRGIYLDDFSRIPGDKPAQRSDDQDVQEGVDRIAALIAEHQPSLAIGVLRGLGVLERFRRGFRWRCGAAGCVARRINYFR